MKFMYKVSTVEYSKELDETGRAMHPTLGTAYMVQINERHTQRPEESLEQPNYSDRMTYVINSPVPLPMGASLYVHDYEMIVAPATVTGNGRIPFNASRNHIWQGYYIEQNESLRQDEHI